MTSTQTINTIYYRLKPILPRRFQIWMRSMVVKARRKKHTQCWPILASAGRQPKDWPGWPEQKPMALVLTHDVESQQGVAKCIRLSQMERDLGFRSSFNFVVKGYPLPSSVRHELESNGFEVGVHGVYHDGKLFESWRIFRQRARIINQYLEKWNAEGFRAPAMHHNLEWLHELNISYDLSTFDTDPFEPQSDGVSTIFPFWVAGNDHSNRYLEMPYTLVQDFTLFILMKESTTKVWIKKLAWIFNQGGMALLNTHPDYMTFEGQNAGVEGYPVQRYLDFLCYLRSAYQGLYWQALPREVARFYRELSVGMEPDGPFNDKMSKKWVASSQEGGKDGSTLSKNQW